MLIKNATIPTVKGLETVDILVTNGIIETIAPSIDVKRSVEIDAHHCVVLPGFVDLNVRFSNSTLNQSHIDKLALRCLKGGVTTAVVMSDFTPRLESATLLDLVKFKIDQALIDIELSAPLAAEKEDQLHNIATLLNNGASAILAHSNRNANLLRRGMQYATMKDKPLFVQCYEPNLDDNGVMNEGVIASKLGLSGISKVSETTEVAKVSEMALFYGANVVLKTLSTRRSLEIVHAQKQLNRSLFSEVSIHHLAKNDTACDGFNTYAKLMPPLREEKERLALLEALKEGKIDILTSAHAPKSILYKDVAFEDAEFGLGSVEEFLNLAYTYLVKTGVIDFATLVDVCATKPASVLGDVKKGALKEGYCADIILFDPNYSYTISDKHSLYCGDTLFGKVKKVIVKGTVVLEE
jgi:dihydroorotase